MSEYTNYPATLWGDDAEWLNKPWKRIYDLCVCGDNRPDLPWPKTQKARGAIMCSMSNGLMYRLSKAIGRGFITPYNGLPGNLFNYFGSTIFARPCPTVPRHGFVESREVKTVEDIVRVLRETIAADPNGEVILMSKLSGKNSGIATNAGVAWGTGHAGVTSGFGGTRFIPCPNSASGWWLGVRRGQSSTFKEQYEKDIPHCPYLELVEGDGKTELVQLRNGPAQSGMADYLPHKFVVKHILVPDDNEDLLYWEAKFLNNKLLPGTVVQMPEGTSLSSHYAVHAITKGVPVITSHQVHIGETLVPEGKQVEAMSHTDLLHLKEIITHYQGKKLWESNITRNLTATSVATVQAQTIWGNDEHLMKLRGQAAAYIPRLMFAACMGEDRHRATHGPERQYRYDDDGERIEGSHRRVAHRSRNQIYESVLNYPNNWPYQKAIDQHKALISSFNEEGWESSYGGKSWGKVTRANANAIKRVMLFMEKPTNIRWNHVIASLNIAINTSHNSGTALNKWLGNEELVNITLYPQTGFMNQYAATQVLKG
jgi:hypothetical protein